MAQTKLNVVEDTIENQIAELRSQISSLSKSVSARAEGVSEDASNFWTRHAAGFARLPIMFAPRARTLWKP